MVAVFLVISNDRFSGHSFSVVKSATGAENYIDPPRRDTVATGGNGVTIRFVADNPGYVWFPFLSLE